MCVLVGSAAVLGSLVSDPAFNTALARFGSGAGRFVFKVHYAMLN